MCVRLFISYLQVRHGVLAPQNPVRFSTEHPALLHSLFGREDHPYLVDAGDPQSPRAQGDGETGVRMLQNMTILFFVSSSAVLQLDLCVEG